jgi:ATP-binding cassette subfamily B protein/subfamily B ATP-binding cassette protein MsbA
VSYRRLLEIARAHQAALLLAMALSLAESLALLAMPWLGGQAAGQLLDAGALAPVLILLVLALVAAGAMRALVGILSGRISHQILAALRRQMHDHLQALPLAVHQRHSQGDLLALSTWEIDRLGSFLAQTLVSLPAQVLTALGAVILMARIDPVLALVVPLLVPAFYLVARIVGRRLRGLGEAAQRTDAALAEIAARDLAMLPAVKSFTREDAVSRDYAERVAASRDVGIRISDLYAVYGSAMGLVASLGALGLLVLAGGSLREGAMTAAEAVSFLLYAVLLTRPIGGLALVYGRVQAARGTLARLGAILDTPSEPGRDAPRRMARAEGALVLEGVRFAYEGREPALDGVSLRIQPGETVAITGPNGAGKSTLASLLLRYMDPQEGTIRLDGIDLRELRLEDLRRQIGLVPQRPLIFDGTVRDNIGWGREGAMEVEIEAAARLAQAHGFILELPDGYDTRVGEHGVRLSGGQGQRIALARALLKDPPILILDEATSMYDLDGEGAFVAAAASRLRGRTVLLITHRPATLALANRRLHLENGRLIEARDAA